MTQKAFATGGLISSNRQESLVMHRNRIFLIDTCWTSIGSCEIVGSVCEWTIHLAIRPEVASLWSIRWRGEEQDEEVLGPDHLDSLAEELVEDRGIDRDDLLNLLEFSGIEAVEEFARQNHIA
jgi:hypothetical protein